MCYYWSWGRAAAGVAKMATWKGVGPVDEDCMRGMSTSQGQAMYATRVETGFPSPRRSQACPTFCCGAPAGRSLVVGKRK